MDCKIHWITSYSRGMTTLNTAHLLCTRHCANCWRGKKKRQILTLCSYHIQNFHQPLVCDYCHLLTILEALENNPRRENFRKKTIYYDYITVRVDFILFLNSKTYRQTHIQNLRDHYLYLSLLQFPHPINQ